MSPRLLIALGLALPGAAAAQCPVPFAGEVIDPSTVTGDLWLNDQICATPDGGDAIFDLLEDKMGLDGITLTWGTILKKSRRCLPDGWGGRLIDGGYALELVALERAQETFAHLEDYAFRIDGTRVTNWLRQFIDEYAAWDGFEFECLHDSDSRGDQSYVFASNPAGDFAINLFHPWFWHRTAFERASTLVHETAHELEGHVADNACNNGMSCDARFGTVNAQTLQILFLADAVDAYQRDGDSTELTVVNFGQDACGYLPLLPTAERQNLVQQMRNRLQNTFETPPRTTSYPRAAFIVPAPSPSFATPLPNGVVDRAFLIDVLNNARWPCEKVCEPTDFDFPAGSRACNEDFHPFSNSAINGRNRAKCERLNAQIAQGVVPSDRDRLLREAERMEACTFGASEEYLQMTCAEVRAGANHVDDVAAAWPDPPVYVRGYNPEGAIADCTRTYCAEDAGLDAPAAEAACYEWDDATGCMAAQCGDLAAIEAEHGRQSDAYFQAVLCRASRFGRALPSPEADGCDATYARCMIEDRYRRRWLEQLDGEDCWSDTLARPGDDPLFTAHRASATAVSIDAFVAADADGPQVLQNACFMEQIECQTLESLVALDVGRMVRDVDLGPRVELPDRWNLSPTVYDRALRDALVVLADQIDEAGDFAAGRARLRALISQPEARVAMAELIGHDRFFRMGGGHRAERYFSPRIRAQFAGPDAEADPYAPAMIGLPDEEAALATLSARLATDDWTALRARLPRLGAASYVEFVQALSAATSAVEVLEIHDQLRAALLAAEN